MGKKFLLSTVLATLLIQNSNAFDIPTLDNIANNIIIKTGTVENNITDNMSAENEVIITFKDNTDMSEVLSNIKSLFATATTQEYSLIKAIHIKVPNMAFDAIKIALENSPFKDSINTIEPNYAYSYISSSNDTYYSDLWSIENTGQDVNGVSGTDDADMDVKEAWDITKGDSNIVVAVLDTGVDYTHSDLADNMWSGAVNHGYDFAGDDDGNNDDNPMPDTPYDENGHYHGTHVAGTIGAVGDNSNGISGIVQNIQIMAVKIFRPNGYGYTSDILEALDYVSEQIDKGVKVVAINASYGGSGGSDGDSMDQAIQRLGDKGVVFCAAAGNDSKDIDEDPVYPASYSATNIITVSASNQDDELASFANYGKDTVEVVAPGTNILSTYPDNQYAYLNGTSMATPNVTGTVALLASANPNSSVKEIIDAIENNVDTKSDLENKVSTSGRVNAYKAVESLVQTDTNTAPEAKEDSAVTEYETKVTIDVLANDIDSDGDSLSIKSVTTPSNGSVVINENKIDYTPNSGFSGTDSFNYTVDDGRGGEDSAIVTVTVNEKENSNPNATDDSVSVDEDNSILIDVLANDNDSDGDNLTIKSVTQANNGIVEIIDSKIKYTPNENFNGDDSFSYTVVDEDGSEDSAEVLVKINSVNDAPTSKDLDLNTKEDESSNVKLEGSDIDSKNLTYKITKEPENGTLSTNDGVTFTYTPNSNYNGSDSFKYIVDDGELTSNEATVNISIESVNDAPNAVDDSVVTDYETEVTIYALNNDSDVDNDSISIESITKPLNGSAVIDNNTIKYQPNSGFSGDDSFSYTVVDSNGAKSSASITVKVNSQINTAPEAKEDSAVTEYETKVTIDVLSNDIDSDGDSLSIKSVTTPSNGSVVINENKIDYTPNSGFSGTDSFNYTVDDDRGGEDSAVVTVTVKEQEVINNSPIAVDDGTFYIKQDESKTLDVLSNDSDPDGDNLTITSVSIPTNGVIEIINDGKFIKYTPNSGFSGTDSFNYTIDDGNGAKSSAEVTIMVEKNENETNTNDDEKEYIIPIIGDDKTETPTKIIGDFLSEAKDDIYIFKVNDSDAEVEVAKDTGEVELKNISAPIPDTTLPAGTTIELEDKTIKATFNLTTNIKFK